VKKLRWIPVIGYAALIFLLSSKPWPTPSALPPYADKVIHFVIYAGLGFGLLWALRATPLKGYRHIAWIAALAGLLYGATDELHQSFVPGRSPSGADVFADGLGSFAGAWVALITARRMRKECVR
jgi:VanZ family protein